MSDTTKTKDMYQALLDVQKEVPALQKTGVNPHFKSAYITLDNLMEQILPILHKHGFIWLTFPTVLETGEPSLDYRLIYTVDGSSLTGEMSLQSKAASPQDQGSAITYARRYALLAVLGIVADQDDDGNKAQEATVAPITETNKSNILQLLNRLEKTVESLEKSIGKPLDAMTNTEALELVTKLKNEVLRRVNQENA